jgi:serine/threonine protein kinase
VNAEMAAAALGGLNSSSLDAAFAVGELSAPTLLSVRVTECVPGYALSTAGTCMLCPSNFFCLGGSSGTLPCSSGKFSYPGGNSSQSCIPVVFVLVSATLPIPLVNFTSDVQSRFQNALAVTAHVSKDRVVVNGVRSQARRAAEAQVLVDAQIAADNPSSAQTISQTIDETSLNTNLMLQNLPKSSAVTVTLSAASAQAPTGVSAGLIGGSVAGVVVFVLACSFAGYYLSKNIRARNVRKGFLAAVKNAKAGDAASIEHLPPDDEQSRKIGTLSLREEYTAETVLGTGSCSCVVKATKKITGQSLAIKVIVPRDGELGGAELLQLQREGALLQLVTRRKSKYTVHAADSTKVPHRVDVCWFVMEALDGTALDILMRAPEASLFVGEVCIQAARDVLAALKVLHCEDWVHGDVSPGNIIRCATQQQNSFLYKLIDFGSAITTCKGSEGSESVATGSPAYRAPEMFPRPCKASFAADTWSLGVSMFELVTARLPFRAKDDSDEAWFKAVANNVEDRAPDIRSCLSEAQRESFDSNLAKVIAKALEKEEEKRYCNSALVAYENLNRSYCHSLVGNVKLEIGVFERAGIGLLTRCTRLCLAVLWLGERRATQSISPTAQCLKRRSPASFLMSSITGHSYSDRTVTLNTYF